MILKWQTGPVAITGNRPRLAYFMSAYLTAMQRSHSNTPVSGSIT